MRTLDIESYNRNESEAMGLFSNRVNQAFSPALFQNIGYPTRINAERELFRYVDVMQEGRFERYLDTFLGGMTQDEFETFKKFVQSTLSLSKTRFLRAGTGHNALTHSLSIFRHIAMLSDNQPCRVLEVGPGCGYLGAVLAQNGYPYAATDVTQAFYLYQDRLWNQLFPGRVVDGAVQMLPGSVLDTLLSQRAPHSHLVHIPWWEWARLYKSTPPTVDMITCNHVLCEMHHDALLYLFRMARLMFEKSTGPRCIVFEGWGWNAMNRLAFVAQSLYQQGFVLVHNDEQISVAVPREMAQPGTFLPPDQLILGSEITWNNGKLYISEGVRPFQSPGDWSQRVLRGRQRIAGEITVKPAEVKSFLASVATPDVLATEDELFWKFIQHPSE